MNLILTLLFLSPAQAQLLIPTETSYWAQVRCLEWTGDSFPLELGLQWVQAKNKFSTTTADKFFQRQFEAQGKNLVQELCSDQSELPYTSEKKFPDRQLTLNVSLKKTTLVVNGKDQFQFRLQVSDHGHQKTFMQTFPYSWETLVVRLPVAPNQWLAVAVEGLKITQKSGPNSKYRISPFPPDEAKKAK